MKFRNLGRLGLALASLICLLAVFSASAFGAGKPTGVGTEFPHSGLNFETVVARANPNGASTTLTIQYHGEGATEWRTLASRAIGSGTQTETISETLAPRGLGRRIEYRAVAENSYGSSISVVEKVGYFLNLWPSGVIGEDTASYSSSGNLKIEDYDGGGVSKIECNVSGNGEFGPEAIGGAHLNLSVSGCAWYYGGSLRCNNPKIVLEPLSFSNEYAVPSAEVFFRCPEEEVMHVLRYSGRFLTTLGSSTNAWWSPTVEKPVTMVGSGKIDSRTATLTVSSTWKLTGANAGKKFYLKEM